MTAQKPPSDAARAHAVMSQLVLDDRRREVSDATGMSFFRTKTLRRLLAGPIRMSDLAARLETDKPYMTVVVDDLERRGLVTRSVAADDRRAKVVTLTEAGEAVAARAEGILSRPSEGLTELDADEMATLLRLLEKALAAGRNGPETPLDEPCVP